MERAAIRQPRVSQAAEAFLACVECAAFSSINDFSGSGGALAYVECAAFSINDFPGSGGALAWVMAEALPVI